MEIKKIYFQKYLHEIAIEQLREEYLEKGYSISHAKKLGIYNVDLIAKKGDETIVFEIKSEKLTPEKKEQISQLANYLRTQTNYKFLLVLATPPKEKVLEIDNLEQLLFNNLSDKYPDELYDLSSHTRLDEIADIDIDEISITGSQIYVKGSGSLGLELEFGNAGERGEGEGYITREYFPLDFEVTLETTSSNELNIIQIDKLEIDTSSYYE